MMTTNDIRKGMRFKPANGWLATMKDNKRGNIHVAKVEGIHTEIGSVYTHDIIAVQKDDVCTVKLTDSQEKHAQTVKALGLQQSRC